METNTIPFIDDTLQQERAYIATTDPFFGSLILKARMQASVKIPTACTDGIDFWINPFFWKDLNRAKRRGLLKHEVLHKAFCHPTRGMGKDPRVWNMAADYAINLLVKDSGDELPDGGLLDEKYRNMAAEQIYQQLIKEQPEQDPDGTGKSEPCEGGQGGQQPGSDQPGEGDTPGSGKGAGGYQPGSEPWDIGSVKAPTLEGDNIQAEIDQMELDAKTDLQEAAQIAKSAGKLPAGMDRLIDSLCEPFINWRAELQDFFDAKVPNDYSFLQPNRRYSGQAVIMPGLDGVNLGSIIFAADTSGSVSADELKQVSSEITAVADDLEPETLHVLWWDTQVSVQTFEQGDLVDLSTLKPVGGGGTRINGVFDWIDENEPDPVAVVVLTDGHFWDTPEEPDYPVLWAITDKDKYKNWKVPFGDLLYIKID